MTKHSPDAVVEYPNAPEAERWRVKINVAGYRQRLTLSRHESAAAAHVALALWREEVYGEIEQCRHEIAWHTCGNCLGLTGPYGYRQSAQEIRQLIGPGLRGRTRRIAPPAAGRNSAGGYEPDAAEAAGRMDEVREMVQRTTAEQGLPEKVTDPEVVATLMGRTKWKDPVDWDKPLVQEG